MKVLKTKIAGGVIVNECNEIAIVNQKGTSWSLPKGHIEEGETEIDAAIREIHEETGIKELKLIRPLGSYERYKIGDESELKTIIFFLFKTSKQDLHPIDKDNPEALWLKKDKVSEMLTHPKDKEFFLKILKEI